MRNWKILVIIGLWGRNSGKIGVEISVENVDNSLQRVGQNKLCKQNYPFFKKQEMLEFKGFAGL